jgi:hypothetical protein
MDGAARNPQAHSIDRDKARELLGEILGLQDEFFTHNPISRARRGIDSMSGTV